MTTQNPPELTPISHVLRSLTPSKPSSNSVSKGSKPSTVNGTSKDQLEKQLHLSLTDEEAEQIRQINTEQQTCKKCKGLPDCQYYPSEPGFKRVFYPDEFNGQARIAFAVTECRFLREWQLSKRYNNLFETSNIPKAFQNLTLQSWRADNYNIDAYNSAMDLLEGRLTDPQSNSYPNIPSENQNSDNPAAKTEHLNGSNEHHNENNELTNNNLPVSLKSASGQQLSKPSNNPTFQDNNRKHGLYLYGPARTGKTLLACVVGSEYLRHGYGVLFKSLPELLFTLEAEETTRMPTLVELQKAPVLILDDFGAERSTAFNAELLYIILDGRLRSCLPTLITSNYSVEDLKQRYNAAEKLQKRLRELCKVVALS